MENRLLVDWLSVSIRVDDKSGVEFDGELNLDFICKVFNLNKEELTEIGKIPYYETMYKLDNISIKVPHAGRTAKQGFNISMSGSGCRYYEQLQKDGEFCSGLQVWGELFSKLRGLTSRGLAVNISRLDIALDDFTGALDMHTIFDCCRNHEYVSRFRSFAPFDCRNGVYQVCETVLRERFAGSVGGMSVEFGSRESRVFCRIYDKKAEQIQKNLKDVAYLEELKKIPHWVRLELEFKDENAISMANAICDSGENFGAFFAKYVNGVIRFVDDDGDTNRSRLPLKGWWLAFIGTAEKLSLSIGDYRPYSHRRFKDYFTHSLLGTVYTAINVMGLDDVLDCAIEYAQRDKLSKKHKMLCAGFSNDKRDFCSADLWEILKPKCFRPVFAAPERETQQCNGAAALVL